VLRQAIGYGVTPTMQAARIAHYLAVPLRLAPLLFIAVFSVLAALSAHAGLFGIPLALLVLAGFIRYSFALLDAVTRGAAEPPVLTIEMLNPVGEMRSIVVLAIVTAMFFGSNAAAHWMAWPVRALVGVVVLALLLAVIAIQAATGSVAQAVNPLNWTKLMARVPGDYALVTACALAFYLLGLGLARSPLPSLALVAVLMYGWLAVFALIGGLLRERRLDIGIEDADDPEPMAPGTRATTARERDLLVDRIYAEWRGGAHRNAWQEVADHLQHSADALAELHWLHARVSRWPDARMAGRVAQERLARLLAADRKGEAVSLVDEQLKMDPHFRPLAAADLLRLAQLARDIGERRIACTLLRDFRQHYPGDPLQGRMEALQRELAR
jgi:hypothetical protein